MAKGLVNESSLNSIGKAINVLDGTSDTYYPSEMGDAIIDAIPTETASGSMITIDDAANYPTESVVTTLEPVQDLHGYDKPWAGGGGKNLLNFNKESQTIRGITLTNNKGVLTLNGTNDGTGNSDFVIGTYASTTTIIPSGTYKYIISDIDKNVIMLIGFDSTTLGSTTTSATITAANGISAVIVRVASGVSVDNVTVKPMITADTSMTYDTFEPYSNICPISGHIGVELTRTGKNLLDSSKVEQGTLNADGSEKTATTRVRTPYIRLSAGSYTLSNSDMRQVVYVYDIDANKSFIDAESYTAWQGSDFSFALTGNRYVRFIFCKTDNSNVVPSDLQYAQLELGSTATAYEPYTSETHSTTFPQEQSPVYGGEVDWTNGVLRVNYANVDLGTLEWTQNPNYENTFNGTLPSLSVAGNLLKSICSEYVTYSSTIVGLQDYGYAISNPGNLVYVKDINELLPTIESRLSGVQLVYELATPVEIPLTPEVITLLKGDNNIWTDSGTSEIEYKVDLQTYINKFINAQNNASANLLSTSSRTENIEPLLNTEEVDNGQDI